jgi:hypothetical protein
LGAVIHALVTVSADAEALALRRTAPLQSVTSRGTENTECVRTVRYDRKCLGMVSGRIRD